MKFRLGLSFIRLNFKLSSSKLFPQSETEVDKMKVERVLS
jgi:hypothetical protein